VFSLWRRERFAIGGRDVAVRLLPIAQADDPFVAAWLDLESRAVEGNMFLSPHFLLPAVQYLSRARVLLLAIFRRDGAHEHLIGLGAFVARPPTARFPLPHLDAFRSPHTFLTGVLLDRENHVLALEALGAYLSSPTVQWCGIEFRNKLADAALSHIHREHGPTFPLRWAEYSRQRRAILHRDTVSERHEALFSEGGLGKDLRRKRQRLDKLGRSNARVLVGKEVTSETIENFLRLENMGWKGENKSSLLSQPKHADFFRDMAQRFSADERAFFCELRLEGRVIASSSNFVSGRTGFAFKIGWDPEFASVGPGLLAELELMRWLGGGGLDIDYVDSGSVEGAYIQRLWKSSTYLASGVLVGGNVGAAILPALNVARSVKRAVLGAR
jgi:CelD/BcsL family acetyltransferase involved in cellulose biosynthesis